MRGKLLFKGPSLTDAICRYSGRARCLHVLAGANPAVAVLGHTASHALAGDANTIGYFADGATWFSPPSGAAEQRVAIDPRAKSQPLGLVWELGDHVAALLPVATDQEAGGAWWAMEAERSSDTGRSIEQWLLGWEVASRASSHERGRAAAAPPLADPRQLATLKPILEPDRLRAFVDKLVARLAAEPEAISSTGEVRTADGVEAEVLLWTMAGGWWVGLIDKGDQRWRWLIGCAAADDEERRAMLDFSLAKSGASRRYSGLFAEDSESGTPYLVHRGAFRGRSRSIGEQFWRNTRAKQASVWWEDAQESLRAAVVTSLDSERGVYELCGFAAELQRLREMFADTGEETVEHQGPEFLQLEADTQVAWLWEALLGSGPLEADEAIRAAASVLRDHGLADYQRLRRDGPLYAGIDAALQRGIRADCFDRPQRGHVRAIQPDPEALTRDQWRDCLLNAIDHETIDRMSAIRAAAEFAVEHYGAQHQRLRRGGRVERAVKSAINSAIRQGLIERHGTAYIRKLRPTEKRDVREHEAAAIAATAAHSERPESTPTAEVAAPSLSSAQTPAPAESAPPESLPAGGSEPPIPTAPPPETVGEAPPSELGLSLDELRLPTRTMNWADRVGLTTVGELIAWHPESFVRERNIGRGSVRKTRQALQELLGCQWEDARRKWIEPPKAADEDEELEETPSARQERASGWNHLLASLKDKYRKLPLEYIELPARMRAFCEQLGYAELEQLFQHEAGELIAQRNLGRGTISKTLQAVQDYLHELEHPHEDASFPQWWARQMHSLDPMPRLILSRRAGAGGQAETLENLGDMLGITRERVRQIESRTLERLGRKQLWLGQLRRQLDAALDNARAVPVSLLAEEPWWRGIEEHLELFRYVARRLLDSRYHLVTLGDVQLIALFAQDEVQAAQRSVLERVESLEYPAELETIRRILDSETRELDSIVREFLREDVEDRLHFDSESEGKRVLSYGRSKNAELLALLREAPEPVAVTEVHERIGRIGKFPDEVLYFKRGVVGLRRHFPDFEAWQQKLVPQCIELMRDAAPGRQWLVTELFDSLQEQLELPEWLGHWHLASLLRTSGGVSYLGRLRVCLLDEEPEARIHVADHLYDLLDEAGAPLSFDELRARATEATDIAEATMQMTLLYAPFVKLDRDRYGLLQRDVSGGANAIATAVQALVDQLEIAQRGLTSFEAEQRVRELSEAHASWSAELIGCVVRNEPQLRRSRSGGVGLSEWDDIRVPTRAEWVRRVVDEHRGEVALEQLNDAIAHRFGEPLSEREIEEAKVQFGLVTEGEHIRVAPQVEEHAEPEESPPASRRVAATVLGIPAEARQLFEELLREKLNELRALVEAACPDDCFSKLDLLFNQLDAIGFEGKPSSPRIIVFSERIRTLNALKEALTERYKLKNPDELINVFEGTLPDVELQRIKESFGRETSPLRVLLASDAASEGVNLHYHCHHLFHFDIPWSLIRLTQRNGRIDRFGQRYTPQLHYLLTRSAEDTADQQVIDRLIDREKVVYKQLGDAGALLGLYDAEEEDSYITHRVADGQSAHDIIPEAPAQVTRGERPTANTPAAAPAAKAPSAVTPSAKGSAQVDLFAILDGADEDGPGEESANEGGPDPTGSAAASPSATAEPSRNASAVSSMSGEAPEAAGELQDREEPTMELWTLLEQMAHEQPPIADAREATSSLPSLFASDYQLAVTALRQLQQQPHAGMDELRWEADDDSQVLRLYPPRSFQEFRGEFLPSEALPEENDAFLLTAGPDIIGSKIREALESDDGAWPEWQLLWEQHPVFEWLLDSVAAAYARHEAPVLLAPELQKDSALFLFSALVSNQESQPVFTTWFSVETQGTQVGLRVLTLEETLWETGFGQSLTNPAKGLKSLKTLRDLVEPAVKFAFEHVDEQRKPSVNALRKLVRRETRRLEKWKTQKQEQLDALEARYRARHTKIPAHLERKLSSERDNIERFAQNHDKWLRNAAAHGKPYVRLAAVFCGA